MNNINISGNIVANPIVRVNNDKKAANFRVAVRGSKEHTDFINCVAFGQRAEYVEKFATKGARVVVSGSLHTDSYTNKDGNRVNTVEIYVNDVEIVNKVVNADNSVEEVDDDNEVPFD